MFDTADVYSNGLSKEVLGEAIKNRRDKVVISTKAIFPTGEGANEFGLSRFYLARALNASLKCLKIECVDIYARHGFDAEEIGKTVPQVALNWLLQRPSFVNVIIGTRNEEQLRQNLASVGWNLAKKQVAKLNKASDSTRIYPYWHQRQFAVRNPLPV